MEDDELYMVWARRHCECEEQEVSDKGEKAQELSHGDVGQRSNRSLLFQNLFIARRLEVELHTCCRIFLVMKQLDK